MAKDCIQTCKKEEVKEDNAIQSLLPQNIKPDITAKKKTLSESCTKKQKTLKEMIGVKPKHKSLLFPKMSIPIQSVKDKGSTKVKTNKEYMFSFVADNSFMNDEVFLTVFDGDCKIAPRNLYDWDFEITPNDSVIIFSDNNETRNRFSPKKISSSLSIFTRVHVFCIGNCSETIHLCNNERIKIRRVPNKSSCYKLIKKTLLKKQSFITKGETLHEYFYSIFPCVPHIVAMKWLAVGNPIVNTSIQNKNEPCDHMFLVVLDSKSFISKPTNPSVKRTEALMHPHQNNPKKK